MKTRNTYNSSKRRSSRSGYQTNSFKRRPRRNHSRSKSSSSFDVARYIQETSRKQEASTQPEVETLIKHKFKDFNLNQELLTNLSSRGFEAPTEIQDQAIPRILAGRDVIGIANTGTGKTLAFALPIADKILSEGRDSKGERLRALIMCPTRELAQQVEAEIAKLTNESKIYSLVCVGGMPIGRQIRKLSQRPEFVIGTPGRLKDLLDRGVLDLSKFSFAVLDEADQMLDMGFINDMRYILDHFKDQHQTLLFSATMSDEIKRLVSDFTNNAELISVKKREAAITVDQTVRKVSSSESKVTVLAELLGQDATGKTIVFCKTKRGSEKLAKELQSAGINAAAIHGDKPQRTRTKILNRFRAHSITVLVATDVASRGLDIDDITHVINYDLPQTQEDYIHRIGRTGRIGKLGTAVTFI